MDWNRLKMALCEVGSVVLLGIVAPVVLISIMFLIVVERYFSSTAAVAISIGTVVLLTAGLVISDYHRLGRNKGIDEQSTRRK